MLNGSDHTESHVLSNDGFVSERPEAAVPVATRYRVARGDAQGVELRDQVTPRLHPTIEKLTTLACSALHHPSNTSSIVQSHPLLRLVERLVTSELRSYKRYTLKTVLYYFTDRLLL